MKHLKIIIFLFVLLLAALLTLMGRCFYLQFFKSSHYVQICARQQQGRIIHQPQRGVILDCRARVLAASSRIQTIFAEPRTIKDPIEVSNKLADIVDLPAHKICKLITESRNPGFVKIKTNAEVEQCRAARKIYGLGVQSGWKRYYPMANLASHVVGFTGLDGDGLDGIELQYDKNLKGRTGKNVFLANAARRPISDSPFGSNNENYQLRDGVGIILTLDATVQQFARAELLKQYQDFGAESAIAIVASAKTGAILALVSLPDFEPNKVGLAQMDTLRNRAISDEFEPGSLLKPISAAIAIEANAVSKDEKIFCENGNYRGKGFGRIGEYGDHKFGDLGVREILINSSNIGMAKIGQKLGKNKLYNGLELFGFGKKTMLGLPGEVDGKLRPLKKWDGYSITRVPFGQEISVTAIQLVKAFCILANDGKSVRPFLIEAIVDNNGQIIMQKKSPSDVGFVVKPEVANWLVREAMAGVVNEGTGKKAQLKKWQVFGKTGTAQLAKSDGTGYSENEYVASFVAGAPAENPQLIVLVSIFKPDVSLGKGYTGGTVAAPVAGKILEKTLNYLEVESSL